MMFPCSVKLGKSQLGVCTFSASAHPSESCGSNGLPLTPNSIHIIGKSRSLMTINHPYLCAHVDVLRGKHERIMVVQEYYLLNFKEAIKQYPELRGEKRLTLIAHQVLQGLTYLNNFGSVMRNLSPENILIDQYGQVKLFHYGLYFMTEGGSTVSFPIGELPYLAPELCMASVDESRHKFDASYCCPFSDVWSLGLILLEALLALSFRDRNSDAEDCLKILNLNLKEDVFSEFYSNKSHHATLQSVSESMRDFLRQCLNSNPEKRSSPCELLLHPLFVSLDTWKTIPVLPQFPVVDASVALVDFDIFKISQKKKSVMPFSCDKKKDYFAVNQSLRFSDDDHLSQRSIAEIYYLWKLAGGDIQQEIKKQRLVSRDPNITLLPSVMLSEGEIFGAYLNDISYDFNTVIVLPLNALRKRLQHINPVDYFPLITCNEGSDDQFGMNCLPIIIREKDVEYQFHRLVLFERLLKAYPYKLESLIREVKVDIPPLYRNLIWAALLRVNGNVEENYSQIDKETPTQTDRQIEVDIPRCHQYNELLSSPEGHLKFMRVLKAWVASHPFLVYWQGLDSLCAPFLYLNFNNEALAYACFSSFIDKYLHNIFLRDNSGVIQEYLAKFSQLIAFHEPQLLTHLDSIGFIPELFAIPWFLTMFTHVFPLEKIFLLWDALLLGSASLPLCVGVAILRQLKHRLCLFGFNECILLFSDLPDIEMEKVVYESQLIFNATPTSITFRKHQGAIAKSLQECKEDHFSNDQDETCDVELSELKREKCSRISAYNTLQLMKEDKLLLVDIRSVEEYLHGTLPGAINIVYETVFDTNHILIPSNVSLFDVLREHHGKVLVIMSSENCFHEAVTFAECLLTLEFTQVCTLHKGIETFYHSRNLIIPTT